MNVVKIKDWRMLYKIMTIPILSIVIIMVPAVVYLPDMARNKLMDVKKTAVRNAVEVAYGLVEDYQRRVQAGEMTRAMAQELAKQRIVRLNYQPDGYFWINDMNATMVVHPYNPELNGKDVRDYKDETGLALFQKFIDVCQKNGEGFVRYHWPKPGQKIPEAKLSYVKLFRPWNWIVGSGVYIQDVETEAADIREKIILIAMGISVLILVAGLFIGAYINYPLRQAVSLFHRISDGDLTVDVSKAIRNDEVGALMRAVHSMIHILRNQTRSIIECTETLASAISEISALTSELSNGAQETSGSLDEITTTVEDVRQTARSANENAEQVAKTAENTAQISDSGKQAVTNTVRGMNRIKDEMAYVAEGIIKLSEQMQNIGEIIATVNDLADQSNLLSVNASIEAAKAGEHGKGFAVVAHEMKSLAEQSKEATNQIRNILNEIQRATRAAVMATERGNRAVEKGVELSILTGESIGKLSDSVQESAWAAAQIASSSQQQLMGMDQLAQAMENIKGAFIQNVNAAKKLQGATDNLKDLGHQLKQLAGQFKV